MKQKKKKPIIVFVIAVVIINIVSITIGALTTHSLKNSKEYKAALAFVQNNEKILSVCGDLPYQWGPSMNFESTEGGEVQFRFKTHRVVVYLTFEQEHWKPYAYKIFDQSNQVVLQETVL